MVGQFIDMIPHGYDLSIQVALEGRERFGGVFGIPDRGRSHAENFRTLLGRPLKVFSHYTVVRVILAGVVTLVENHQGHL